MASPTPPTPPSPDTDVRALGLVALHRLARQGHEAAGAELARRMREVPAAQARAGSSRDPTGPRRGRGATAEPDTATADAEAQRLQLMAQLAPDRDRSGPPRLVGLVLIAWGLILTLGGLILLAQAGNAYYVFCGVACGAVGALLMRCSWRAAPLHLGLLVVALGWAWAREASVLAALASALPLLAPLLWLALPAVREPLS